MMDAWEREIRRDTHDYRDRIKELEALVLETQDAIRVAVALIEPYVDVSFPNGEESPNKAMLATRALMETLEKSEKVVL